MLTEVPPPAPEDWLEPDVPELAEDPLETWLTGWVTAREVAAELDELVCVMIP